MTRLSSFAAFALPTLAGLAAAVWVGAGYAGSHPLALAVTGAIVAFFLLGVVELYRYRQATQSLVQAVDRLQEPAPALADWLGAIHPSLRGVARQRVEGERAGLPAPALTPYLAGLLVLLGMLGTFAGMVVTLRGTGVALESATDLAAVRASLAAPVKGLGVAFGTSLAGIATSAMLGLLSAVARRDRLLAGQQLDQRIATTLRAYSPAHQREESFRLLQRQSEALPALADRLHTMMGQLEQQHAALQVRLLTGQDRFHQQAEASYTGLAQSVGLALKESLADSARQAGAAIQPAVEATLAGLAREASALHSGVSAHVERQLSGLAERFDASNAEVARHWAQALTQQQQAHEALARGLSTSLDGFSTGFSARAAALVEQVSAQLAGTTDQWAQQGQALLARQTETSQSQAAELQRSLGATASLFEQHTAALLQGAQQVLTDGQAQAATRDTAQLAAWREAMGQHERSTLALATDTQQALAATAQSFEAQVRALQQDVAQTHAALHTQAAERDAQQLSAWGAALAEHQRASLSMAGDTQQALASTAQSFQAQAKALLDGVAQTHSALQAQAAERDTQQLGAWSDALARHQRDSLSLAGDTQQALAATAQSFEVQAKALLDGVAQTHTALQAQAAERDTLQLAAWAASLAQHAQASQSVAAEAQQALAATSARFADQATALTGSVDQAYAALRQQLADQEAQRLSAWNASLTQLAGELRAQWQQTGADSARQQQAICDTLAATAQAITSQSASQAQGTISEIGRLMDAAAAAPRAAAEVIGELRDKLTDSMARDNAMLDERARVLETLHTLLDTVQHASTAQRQAIDGLVGGSSDVLERIATRFAERIETDSGRLADAAAQIGAGATEVASLGDVFGQAVQAFGESNAQLTAHLQQLDATLTQSIARSDEQLAYYVAQAREVIDLSLSSQKQVVDDLQRLARERASAPTATAATEPVTESAAA